ncbi:MAG TPA: hypothetical protein VFX65_10735 [Candidatus Limnocylindrales bacterium]|nr:hypothetical protein [Candidatus Limnocylindrales bacterium]
MGFLMDLVAGDSREILLAISVDDWAGFDDPDRFDGHVALGGAMDPTWLDRFSEAVRTVTGADEPADFIDARRELDGPGDIGERTVERVDPSWITAIARVGDRDIDAIAGRWIELLEEEIGALPREEKPWIRQVAGDLVAFARRADASPAVILAWSL